MDANIIYFSIHQAGPQDSAAWGAVIIDDGEMESFSNCEQTELQCALNGLTTCLKRIPRSSPTIIRSNHRIILKIGNSWITQWRNDGWEHEVDKSAIEEFIQTIDNRNIQWFHPPFADPIDKRVQEVAKGALGSQIVETPPVIVSTDPITKSETPIIKQEDNRTISNPNARILAYVDAISDGNLGAWCFALIDKPSGFALFKGNAHRHSTSSRALLQGCVELLSSLKERQLPVEIRTVSPELYELLKSLIHNPSLEPIPEIWSRDSAFVSQLSFWIEQCILTPRLLSESDQNGDAAIQETHEICIRALSQLNQGLSATHSNRRLYSVDSLTQ